MKIAIELVNGKVSGVYSDYSGEVETYIYEDVDVSKMTDEEVDALDNEISSAPYILYCDTKNQIKDPRVDMKYLYDKFKEHIDHNIICVVYGDIENPVDVCIECKDCGCVLISQQKISIKIKD